MKQTLIRTLAMGWVLLFAAGCSQDTPPVAHGPGDDDALTEQTKFEKGKDEPINADTHFAAGQLAETRGDNDTAIAQYRASLKVSPKHQPSLYRMAVLQTQLKQFPQAIATWKTYVLATGEAAFAYGNLGFCYELAGQMNEAEQAYQRGISRNGKEQSCRINYGAGAVSSGADTRRGALQSRVGLRSTGAQRAGKGGISQGAGAGPEDDGCAEAVGCDEVIQYLPRRGKPR
jgi:tetratricopeptide (TPR) repeat protein